MKIRRRPEPDGERPEGEGPDEAGIVGGGCARHRLRADAARNREAIVAAAREMFADRGLGAPLEDIAARAGVGIGTLYRRFPARQDLIDAALAGQVARYAAEAERALAEPDAWAALVGFVRRACELQACDRGLAEVLAMARPAGSETERLRGAAGERIDALIERAKADGALRPGVTGEDLALLLIGTGAIMHVTRADKPDAWQRFVTLALEGFAPARRALTPGGDAER